MPPLRLFSASDAWNCYMGGKGGFSNFVDQNVMNGSVGELGTAVGAHVPGGSYTAIAIAGAKVAGYTALLFLPGGEEEVGAFDARGRS